MGQAVWIPQPQRQCGRPESAACSEAVAVCGVWILKFQLLSCLGYTCSVGRHGNFS